MGRLGRPTKAESASKQRDKIRKQRPKVKGVYLREVKDDVEVYNITVCLPDGGKASKRLSIPCAVDDAEWKARVNEVRELLLPKREPEQDTRQPFKELVKLYTENRRLRASTASQIMLYLDGYGYDDDENLRLCRALRDSEYKTSTKRVRIKAIRGVFRYIREELEVPVKDPTKGMETPDGEPRSRIPTHDELMTLLLRIDHERYEPDSLFVRLLMATGARCSTILHLRPCDMGVDHRLSLYNVKCGRKYKYPQLITDAETLKLWDSVCEGRKRDEPIFDATSANRLGARMRRWFGRDADGQTISAHSLRHLKATELARKGCPIKLAALVLDASPAVIMRTYQNLSQEDVDNAMRNF